MLAQGLALAGRINILPIVLKQNHTIKKSKRIFYWCRVIVVLELLLDISEKRVRRARFYI